MEISKIYQNKNSRKALTLRELTRGETGIRTPGASQHNGFQDRRNRPLCHLSKTPSGSTSIFQRRGKGTNIFLKYNSLRKKIPTYCHFYVIQHRNTHKDAIYMKYLMYFCTLKRIISYNPSKTE